MEWNFRMLWKSAGTRLCGSRSDGGREGLDAGRKMAIMASLHFIQESCLRMCIRKNYKNYGGRYRLCQRVWQRDQAAWCGEKYAGRNRGRVYPVMIARDHPLASVRDSLTLYLFTEMQWTMRCSTEEAQERCRRQSAVVGMWSTRREIEYGCSGRISCTCYQSSHVKDFEMWK